MEITGIKIDGVHTYTDWELNLESFKIPLPEAKTNYIDLPGADGDIDLSEALTGYVVYNSRDGVSFTFSVIGSYMDWHNRTKEIANYLHGQRRKIIIDSDPGYFYIGRLLLDSEKTNEVIGQIVISGVMEPYKYEITSSVEVWLWDSFSFVDGAIREYKDLLVSGNLSVTLFGSAMRVVPIITVSAPMTATFLGKTYNLVKGSNKIYAITLWGGKNTLTLKGSGTVTIDYRGGSL